MESLFLFRRALSSPTMCRFIPALSVPELEKTYDAGRTLKRAGRLKGLSRPLMW